MGFFSAISKAFSTVKNKFFSKKHSSSDHSENDIQPVYPSYSSSSSYNYDGGYLRPYRNTESNREVIFSTLTVNDQRSIQPVRPSYSPSFTDVRSHHEPTYPLCTYNESDHEPISSERIAYVISKKNIHIYLKFHAIWFLIKLQFHRSKTHKFLEFGAIEEIFITQWNFDYWEGRWRWKWYGSTEVIASNNQFSKLSITIILTNPFSFWTSQAADFQNVDEDLYIEAYKMMVHFEEAVDAIAIAKYNLSQIHLTRINKKQFSFNAPVGKNCIISSILNTSRFRTVCYTLRISFE